MRERELRRWLDGEMTEEEARAFLGALPAAERREAEALGRLVDGASRLDAPTASAEFGSRAMARVRARRPPRRTWWTWLRAPALSPLGALALALLAVAATFGVSALRPHGGDPARVVARLAYRAPLARQVAVAGDFNAWNPEASRMRRGPGGVWTLEIPLRAGARYQYRFVVDGRWTTDPEAPATVEDGFGGVNAVLDL